MKLDLATVGRAMQAVGDYEQAQDLVLTRVQTDSRLVEPGDLFVCIQGERFDGHHFVRDAVHKGASAVVVERPLMDLASEIPMLLVHDSIVALGLLAKEWRRRFKGRVVAITGTAGKTTVKEILAAVLGHTLTVGKNYKNFNNALGIALSILSFHGREEFWVLEAGISEQGEMDALASMLEPDLAVIHNVGPAHLQGLGSVQGVATEKTCLLRAVPPSGAAVVSADYPELEAALPDRPDMQVLRFSTQAQARADCVVNDPPSAREDAVDIRFQGEKLRLRIPRYRELIGENILAAICTAAHLGVPAADMEAGLAATCLPEHRGQTFTWGGFEIIDDCYNANPLSMRCALHKAREAAGDRALILILGEMKELGAQARESHFELGSWAAEVKADHVLYFGSYTQDVQQAYTQKSTGRFHPLQNEEQFGRLWAELGCDSGVVLVKGSRGCALERFVQALERELKP